MKNRYKFQGIEISLLAAVRLVIGLAAMAVLVGSCNVMYVTAVLMGYGP